jgi:hypothetical protein
VKTTMNDPPRCHLHANEAGDQLDMPKEKYFCKLCSLAKTGEAHYTLGMEEL